MSSKKTADFLNRLSTDAKLREEFKKDHERTMTKAGLSAEGKAALKSGDPEKIRKHLGDDAPPGMVILVIIA